MSPDGATRAYRGNSVKPIAGLPGTRTGSTGLRYENHAANRLSTAMLFRTAIAASLLTWTMAALPDRAIAGCAATLDHEIRRLGSKETVRLCDEYGGRVLLVVNTASRCGYTPQYEGLEELQRRYQARGLVVLGFPSNDFGGQEPGGEEQIANFCRLTYDVGFPMFRKTQVAEGTETDPFFRQLAEQAGGYPEWNFHKYLINREGKTVASFPSQVRPLEPKLIDAIEQLL